MSELQQLLGRAHPLVLHAPLGALAALVFVELVSLRGGGRMEARRPLALFCALTGVAAAVSGWMLADSGDFDPASEVVVRHRWSGVALAALLVLLPVVARAARARAYLAVLTLSLACATFAGHLGATLTHGAGYFSLPARAASPTGVEPTRRKGPPVLSGLRARAASPNPKPADSPPAPPAPDDGYEAAARVLTELCVGCHGPTKQKGQLALHAREAIEAGGSSGPALVPGQPAESELWRRLQLPPTDDEHMPPEGKPQPTPEQLAALERWIRGGPASAAEPEPPAPEPAPGPEPAAEHARGDPAGPLAPVPAPAPDAALALALARVHAERIDPTSGALWVDASTRPDLDDAELARLLAPLADSIVELGLARTRAGPATLAVAGRMRWLERLDLCATKPDAQALSALAGHPGLAALNLTDTASGSAAVELALRLPALLELRLCGAGVDPIELERLARERPALVVHAGAAPRAALEQEPPVVLAPRAEQAGPKAVSGAGPAESARCPLTGEPADPRFALDAPDGELAFCCASCLERFRRERGLERPTGGERP